VVEHIGRKNLAYVVEHTGEDMWFIFINFKKQNIVSKAIESN